MKSLWESTSSSEASSTTLRPPPIRRGALPKEGSFPRLETAQTSRATVRGGDGVGGLVRSESERYKEEQRNNVWVSALVIELIQLLAQENEFGL